MPKVAQKVLMFAPERTGEVERFAQFYTATYNFNDRDRRAVGGVLNHLRKAYGLRQLAGKLIANLDVDEAELEAHGATRADNASELAMVVEASILEAYSSLDCVVNVLFGIYNPAAGDKKRSTRRFFSSPELFDPNIPAEIGETVKKTGWYKRLMVLRDELTHLATGSVSRDRETRSVRYFHQGIKEGGQTLIIEDVFSWLDTLLDQVNQFVGYVFHFLNNTLSDAETTIICGMVDGRMLMRLASGKPPVTFNSGRCVAHEWFDKPENPTCPFVQHCGAYARKASYSEVS